MKKFANVLMFLMLAVAPVFAQSYNYGKFTATTPSALVAGAPTQGTTNKGQSFTMQMYQLELANKDIYLVGVSTYPFTVTTTSLEEGLNGFVSGVPQGKLIAKNPITLVSGQPALAAAISSIVEGREVRFAVVVSYQGSTFYQFVFGSYLDTKDTDITAFHTFLETARIN
jgi:hypothetical protein